MTRLHVTNCARTFSYLCRCQSDELSDLLWVGPTCSSIPQQIGTVGRVPVFFNEISPILLGLIALRIDISCVFRWEFYLTVRRSWRKSTSNICLQSQKIVARGLPAERRDLTFNGAVFTLRGCLFKLWGVMMHPYLIAGDNVLPEITPFYSILCKKSFTDGLFDIQWRDEEPTLPTLSSNSSHLKWLIERHIRYSEIRRTSACLWSTCMGVIFCASRRLGSLKLGFSQLCS